MITGEYEHNAEHEIKNNAWVTWITIFCHEWGDPAMIFTSDFVNHCRIASRVTKNVFIHGNECIILFLMCHFMSWTQNSTKNNYRSLISPLPLRTFFSDLALWRHHRWSVTSCERGVLDLWRHSSCTRKLAQRRSSLVNNNREYRFLTTRYSRLSV